VVAVIFETLVAIRALLTAVDDASDADEISDLVALDMGANRRNPPNDLVSGDAGIECAGPFRTNLVKIGMTDAAEGNGDLNVVCADRAAGDIERLERLVAGVSAVSFDGHILFSIMQLLCLRFVKRPKAVIVAARSQSAPNRNAAKQAQGEAQGRPTREAHKGGGKRLEAARDFKLTTRQKTQPSVSLVGFLRHALKRKKYGVFLCDGSPLAERMCGLWTCERRTMARNLRSIPGGRGFQKKPQP